MKLTNQSIGNVLKVFLIIALITGGINLISTFIFTYFYYEMYIEIASLDRVVVVVDILIWYVACILFLIWIFKVHADLKKINPEYRISPGGSLARILIPFYNIYGDWSVFSTMADYFKEQNTIRNIGKRLALMIPFFYILLFGTQLLNRSILSGLTTSDQMLLLTVLAELLLVVVCFVMAQNILNALPNLEPEQAQEKIS